MFDSILPMPLILALTGIPQMNNEAYILSIKPIKPIYYEVKAQLPQIDDMEWDSMSDLFVCLIIIDYIIMNIFCVCSVYLMSLMMELFKSTDHKAIASTGIKLICVLHMLDINEKTLWAYIQILLSYTDRTTGEIVGNEECQFLTDLTSFGQKISDWQTHILYERQSERFCATTEKSLWESGRFERIILHISLILLSVYILCILYYKIFSEISWPPWTMARISSYIYRYSIFKVGIMIRGSLVWNPPRPRRSYVRFKRISSTKNHVKFGIKDSRRPLSLPS